MRINLSKKLLLSLGFILAVNATGVLPGCKASSVDSNSYASIKSSILKSASDGNESLVKILESIINDTTDSRMNTETIAFILASLSPEIAKERLTFLSNHSNQSLRLLASEALGIRGDEESVVLLKKMVADRDRKVREAAFEAIAESSLPEGEVLLRKEVENSGNYSDALRAAGSSKYRTIWIPLILSMVKNWDKEFCTPDFIERLMVIRRLLDSNVHYYIKKRNAAMETPRQIRMIGIGGDDWALKMLMDKTSNVTQRISRDPNIRTSLEALSIIPNERAIVHLLVIRKNAVLNGNIDLISSVDSAIKNAFFFNKYMIINGDDDFKLIGLRALLVFGMTSYRDEVVEVLTALKSTKPKNPLILNTIKSCFLFIEQQNKNHEIH